MSRVAHRRLGEIYQENKGFTQNPPRQVDKLWITLSRFSISSNYAYEEKFTVTEFRPFIYRHPITLSERVKKFPVLRHPLFMGRCQ